ncbi:hypothetical protein SAMN05216456_1896 [Devosia crocina]|uniref:Collagen triple helix repeat-containing protein n=1 Tax=Devosia crocina TaxID=429728 RepID=A0A1I7NEW5_9HYPH|nr:collagen-like protein [Devosia crocina]SFV33133.1 hypothetical protein SAMN05216456_1896 [Devosia crocina]
MTLPTEIKGGTATIAQGERAVTGQNTRFTLSRPGDVFWTPYGNMRIASVQSDTALTLAYDWVQQGQAGGPYEIRIVTDGLQAGVRELLELLAAGNYATPDAKGTLAQRAAFDGEPQGFIFWQIDVDPFLIYVKLSAALGDWTEGVSLQGATGGPGQPGPSGRNVELRSSGTHVQWRLVGDPIWSDLVALELLRGADGREVQFQTSETHIQWRYAGASEWSDLIALSLLKGEQGDQGDPGNPGADGREIELSASESHVQWRYVGETDWKEVVPLIALKGDVGDKGDDAYAVAVAEGFVGSRAEWLASLKGEQGDSFNVDATGTFAERAAYDGEAEGFAYLSTDTGELFIRQGSGWSDGIPFGKGADGAPGQDGSPGADGEDGDDGEPGADGADGREVELQKSPTHVQWRYAGEDGWTDLIALVDLKGEPGSPGRDGTDGDPGAPGSPGNPGADGREIELQVSQTHVQWRLAGGAWANLIALAELQGPPGATTIGGIDGLQEALDGKATAAQGAKADTAVQPAALGAAAAMNEATAAQLLARTADVLVAPDTIGAAKAWVTLAYAATRSLVWTDAWARVCILSGNMAVSNPTNIEAGDTIMLLLKGGTTTERTVSWGTYFRGNLPTETVTSARWLLVTLTALSTTEIATSYVVIE